MLVFRIGNSKLYAYLNDILRLLPKTKRAQNQQTNLILPITFIHVKGINVY